MPFKIQSTWISFQNRTVYLCQYKKNRKCVLKEIQMDQPCARSSKQFEQLVKHEIYLLLHLNHPRIIQLFDYFCERNYVYIVMEYANNGTLTNLIDKRRQNGYNHLTLSVRKTNFLCVFKILKYFWISFSKFYVFSVIFLWELSICT